MELTRGQAIALGAGYLTGIVIQTAAGHFLVKKYEAMEKEHRDIFDVVNGLAQIATYQRALINKHHMTLDDFDHVVIKDMEKELDEHLKKVRYLRGEKSE